MLFTGALIKVIALITKKYEGIAFVDDRNVYIRFTYTDGVSF